MLMKCNVVLRYVTLRDVILYVKQDMLHHCAVLCYVMLYCYVKQDMLLTICQTCMMLSSDTLQSTQASFGFQEKSEIFAVWPPWMN